MAATDRVEFNDVTALCVAIIIIIIIILYYVTEAAHTQYNHTQ